MRKCGHFQEYQWCSPCSEQSQARRVLIQSSHLSFCTSLLRESENVVRQHEVSIVFRRGNWGSSLLGKMPLTKLTRKSHVQGQGLMTGTSCLADLGKMVQEESELGPGMAFYRRGWVRGWHMHRGPWWGWSLGGACLGEWEILLKGGAVYWEWLHFPRGETWG
jgi:hypothetical protein